MFVCVGSKTVLGQQDERRMEDDLRAAQAPMMEGSTLSNCLRRSSLIKLNLFVERVLDGKKYSKNRSFQNSVAHCHFSWL